MESNQLLQAWNVHDPHLAYLLPICARVHYVIYFCLTGQWPVLNFFFNTSTWSELFKRQIILSTRKIAIQWTVQFALLKLNYPLDNNLLGRKNFPTIGQWEPIQWLIHTLHVAYIQGHITYCWGAKQLGEVINGIQSQHLKLIGH